MRCWIFVVRLVRVIVVNFSYIFAECFTVSCIVSTCRLPGHETAMEIPNRSRGKLWNSTNCYVWIAFARVSQRIAIWFSYADARVEAKDWERSQEHGRVDGSFILSSQCLSFPHWLFCLRRPLQVSSRHEVATLPISPPLRIQPPSHEATPLWSRAPLARNVPRRDSGSFVPSYSVDPATRRW